MQIMKALVTGGCGFIGSNFVNYMSTKYPMGKFIVLDIMDYCASFENVNKNPNIEIVVGDIGNKELVSYLLQKFEIDTIIHFAAQSHVDASFFNSIEFTKTNVLGTHTLLETVRMYNEKTNNIKVFFHMSTDEVFGPSTTDIMMTETSFLSPSSPYASSKVGAEALIQAYKHSYKLPVLIARSNNCYGENQFPEKIIPKFICNLLNNKKLPIQGAGTARRNFIEVNDTCMAIETILSKGELGEIYNISSDHANEYSVLEVAKILVEIIHPESNFEDYLEFVEDRKFNDCRYYISSDKLERLEWKPIKTNFLEEVTKLVEWYKINKTRYRF